MLLALFLTAGGCRRYLQPPEPSYKPTHRAGKALHPPPASAKQAPASRPGVQEHARRSADGTPEPAPVRPALPKVADPYDEARPCYSRGQMARAEGVLFDNGEKAERPRWLHAINRAVHRLGAPCGDEDLLVLVLTTIQLESGVSADPPLENRNLEGLFQLRLKKIKADRKSTRLNSSHIPLSRMPSSA